MGDSFSASYAKCIGIGIGTPDQYGRCSAGQALQDVGASTNASVDKDRNSAIHPFRNPWQSFDCWHYCVQISCAVVGNHKTVDFVLKSKFRIVRMKNSLDQKSDFRN